MKIAFASSAASGKMVRIITLSGGVHTAGINQVTLSPGGTRIATASEDNTAKIWDTATGRLLLTLYSPVGVENLAFTPDERRLVTANQDKLLRVYVLRIEDLLELARSRLTRALTKDECQTFWHLPSYPNVTQ